MKAEEFQKKYGKQKSLRKESAQSINKRMTESFLKQCREANFPEVECEFQFHYERKWRTDFCFRDAKICIEAEGLHGRHQFIGGFLEDMKKYNELTRLGYALFRFTVEQVFSGYAIKYLKQVIELN